MSRLPSTFSCPSWRWMRNPCTSLQRSMSRSTRVWMNRSTMDRPAILGWMTPTMNRSQKRMSPATPSKQRRPSLPHWTLTGTLSGFPSSAGCLWGAPLKEMVRIFYCFFYIYRPFYILRTVANSAAKTPDTASKSLSFSFSPQMYMLDMEFGPCRALQKDFYRGYIII